MTRYKFTFESETEFSMPVSDHSFMLRVTPLEDEIQHIESHSVTVFPTPDSISRGKDAWGAVQDYGIMRDMHREYRFRSEGVVEVAPGVRHDPKPSPVFLTPTPLTAFCPAMRALCTSGKDVEAAARVAMMVKDSLSYVPASTDVTTNAETAFLQGKGVCQDYAHVMIAICRECGMPARYVCGFVTGEGETHAWTEIWHDGAWYGFDATSGLRCDDRYIALAFGRDASDCSVSRGTFMGASLQHTTAKVKVEID